MSEVNNPRGIGLSEAQTAISSLLSPDEDNEATEALDEVDEEEYSEDAETEQADDDEDDSSEEDADLDEDEESDDDEDQSLDILSGPQDGSQGRAELEAATGATRSATPSCGN